jgi:hypothetical protein
MSLTDIGVFKLIPLSIGFSQQFALRNHPLMALSVYILAIYSVRQSFVRNQKPAMFGKLGRFGTKLFGATI